MTEAGRLWTGCRRTGAGPWRSWPIPTTSSTARRPRWPAGPPWARDVRYVLATRGEAGIDSMAPDQAGPLRTAEQVAAGAAVGVSVVEFLDHPDGLVINGIELRAGPGRGHPPPPA